MSVEYSNRTSRTQQLWSHLAGLFGADSLKRKFGSQAPVEWDAALTELSDAQLTHGLRELLRAGGEHIPSLPSFMASCRNAREWINPLPDAQQIADQRFDGWDMAGNRHLLAYVLAAGSKHSYFDAAQTQILIEWKNAWVRDCRDEGAEVPVETQKIWFADCMERARHAGAVGGCPAHVGRIV